MHKKLLSTMVATLLSLLSTVPAYASDLEGVWAQPDKALLFLVKDTQGKPLVEKVYDYTQAEAYCDFDATNSEVMKNYFVDAKVTMLDDGSMQWRQFDTSFPQRLVRLAELPEACRPALSSHEQGINFDVLWQFFDEYYANFDLRIGGKNTWRELGDYYRSMIDEYTTESELYDIMASLLDELHDGHIDLFYQGDFEQGMEEDDAPLRQDMQTFEQAFASSYGYEPDTEDFVLQMGKSFVQSFALVDDSYLQKAFHGPEKSFDFGGFPSQPVYTWGLLKNKTTTAGKQASAEKVGYARILQELHFEGSPRDSSVEHYQQATQTIDKMMAFFKRQDIDALVIDLRLNFGGDDAIDNYLLQYLLDKERTVLKSQSYIKGSPQAVEDLRLSPNAQALRNADNAFPIYVLTSNYTVSAGEILTMELMALPKVKTVGYTTNGIFADTHTRELPNGWIFQLPFNKNMAFDGQLYEKLGIPANIAFAPSDNYLMKTHLDAGRDIILDKLLSEVVPGQMAE